MNLKLILLFALLASLGFATSGSGTIQDCQSNGWDYCTINTSSTITLTDFSIVNTGVNISAGVTVTLNASRLKINSSSYINIFGVINGSGWDGSGGTVKHGGNGGTGGSAFFCPGAECNVAGAVNGSNGVAGTNGSNLVGNGSSQLPFIFTPGVGGTSSVNTKGHFYATGYCLVKDGGSYATAGAGGSGHAIYLISGTINVTGKILADGGDPVAAGGGTSKYCGGAGGGEIILKGNAVVVSGNITALGGDAYNYAANNNGDGGDGGIVSICSPNIPTITGIINVTGGTTSNNLGDNGTNGSLTNCYAYPNWNVTFNCTDEMNSNVKNFTAIILNGTGQILITSAVNSYSVIPAETWNYTLIALQHPTGVYQLCWNGTTRYYVAATTGSYNIRGYSLNTTLGSYYSFYVKNSLGAVVPNVQVSAYRFDPGLGAYAVVEQGITDSGGAATFYLQPLVPYQMVFIASGYVTMTYNFLPSTTSSISINLNPGGGGNGTNGSNTTLPQPMPNYQFAYGDVSFHVEPNAGTYTNDTNVTYTVASANGLLEYWGMTVSYVNGTNTTAIYTNNLTTTTGGTMNYTASAYGTYILSVWFKEQNFSLYTPFPTSFNIINITDNSFFNTRNHFISTHVVSDWVFYFIAVVISMLVAGFVSRYTYEGAAWVGLIVLWGFTIFMTPTLIPASGVIYTALMGGAGGTTIQITAWMATSLATIGVLATTYLMKAGL